VAPNFNTTVSLIITNNDFVEQSAGTLFVVAEKGIAAAGKPVVCWVGTYNSIYWDLAPDSATDLAVIGGAAIEARYCDLQAGTSGSPGVTIQNSISADPLFADFVSLDFELLPGSPCKAAGSNTYWNKVFSIDSTVEGVDYVGKRRILDGAIEMGSHEYAP
jgi:hypothetical protein